MDIYLVGGAVRDQLLGLPVKEHDWVIVGAKPQALLNSGYRAVGKDFPVFLHPETGDQYALARTERKTSKGYYGFECYAAPDVTLVEDLKRRDLTINAMAQTQDGQIIDPYGGQKDLQQRVLRHVSPAFVEDPLRVLRIARFSARFSSLGFTIAEETMQLLRTIVTSGEVEHLVVERVWQELERSLQEDHPEVFVKVLQACGAWPVLFPELTQVPDELPVLTQAVQLSSNKPVRFAALVYPLAKDLQSTQALLEHYPVPRDFQALVILIFRLHDRCQQSVEFNAEQLLALLEEADALRRLERFKQLLLVCEAEDRSKGFVDEPYPQKAFLMKALQCIKQVDVQAIISEGMSGLEIKQALYQQRLEALQHFLAGIVAS